jgi:hypothetical protein
MKSNLHFNSEFIAGNENYETFEAELNSRIEPKYLDKIIYVSKKKLTHKCLWKCIGDIEIKEIV